MNENELRQLRLTMTIDDVEVGIENLMDKFEIQYSHSSKDFTVGQVLFATSTIKLLNHIPVTNNSVFQFTIHNDTDGTANAFFTAEVHDITLGELYNTISLYAIPVQLLQQVYTPMMETYTTRALLLEMVAKLGIEVADMSTIPSVDMVPYKEENDNSDPWRGKTGLDWLSTIATLINRNVVIDSEGLVAFKQVNANNIVATCLSSLMGENPTRGQFPYAIHKVAVKVSNKKEYVAGVESSKENQMVVSNVFATQSTANNILTALKVVRYQALKFRWYHCPINLTPLDFINVEYKGETLVIPIMNLKYTYTNGGLYCDIDTTVSNSSNKKADFKGSLNSRVEVINNIAQDLTTRVNVQDGEIEAIISEITVETDPDGSKVMIKDKVSQIEQTVDGIKSEVSEVEIGLSSSITKVDVMYYLSTSSTSLEGGSWATNPTFEEGKFVWTKTVSTLKNGITKETSPVCITNSSGNDGEDGRGIKSIVEQYYHSTSMISLTGGSWSTTAPTPVVGKFIWTRSVITYTDDTTTVTSPICTTGAKGDKGDTGASGKGVSTITEYYLATSASSGVTTSTSGWTTTIQSMTATNKYLWNYEVIKYTDNSTTTTTPVIIGVHGSTGATGATGNGISSITNYYLATTAGSGVATSTSGWTTTVQTMTTTNKYLWNYEVIKYTNNTSYTGTPRIIGVYGETGANGTSVESIDVEYYLSTSATSLSGGSWSTTAPTWTSGKYMWSRTKTTLSVGSPTYSNPVCITGQQGQTGSTGATGTGISSITEEYYLSTSKTTQTGGSWVTTPPTWKTGTYLWTRSKIVYTNPSSTVYTTPLCDSSWEAVNEIQVGGTNLVKNSDFSQGLSEWTGVGGTAWNIHPSVTYKNTSVIHLSRSSATSDIWNELKSNEIKVVAGETYTMSVDIRYVDIPSGQYCLVALWGYTSSGARRDLKLLNIDGTKDWSRVTLTGTVPTDVVNIRACLSHRRNGTVYATRFKLEKGNKASDWSPATEDVVNSIQVGGRNLLRNSDFTSITFPYGTSPYNWRTASVAESSTVSRTKHMISSCPAFPSGVGGVRCVNSGSSSQTVDIAQDAVVMEDGQTYTMSFYARLDSGSAKTKLQYGTNPYYSDSKTLSSAWAKYSYTFTYDKSKFSNRLTTNIYFGIEGSNFVGYICGFKLEKGIKATDWVPAPEDTQASIDGIQVGGRNLARKGSVCKYTSTSTTTTVDDSNFILDGSATVSRTSAVNEGAMIDRYVAYEGGENYIVSFKMRTVSGTVSNIFFYNGRNHINSKVYIDGVHMGAMQQQLTFPSDTNYHTIKIEFTAVATDQATADAQSTNHIIPQPMKSTASAYTVQILNLKIEKGTRQTDWSPAPEDIQSNIDNIQVGGVNLLRNSNFSKTVTTSTGTNKHPNVYPSNWGGYNSGITNPTTNYHAHIDSDTFGYNVIEYNESDGTRHWKGISQNVSATVKNHDAYILSMDAYATGGGTRLFGGFYYYRVGDTSPAFRSGQFSISKDMIPVNKWGRVSAIVPLNDDVDFSKTISFYIYGYNFTENSILYINNVKLEKGNKATDWSANPTEVEENFENRIEDEVEKLVEGNNAILNLVNQIMDDDMVVESERATLDLIISQMDSQYLAVKKQVDNYTANGIDYFNNFLADLTTLYNSVKTLHEPIHGGASTGVLALREAITAFYDAYNTLLYVLADFTRETLVMYKTSIDQNAKDITMTISKVEVLEGTASNINNHMKFSEDWLELYSTVDGVNSAFKARLSNTRLSFYEGDTVVAYISNQTMNISNAEIENELRVGNLILRPSVNKGIVIQYRK